jgi:hypothetical protein
VGRRVSGPCAEAVREGQTCDFINPDDGPWAACYRCGRRVRSSPVPIDPAAAHVLADIKGTGLRSVRRASR